MIVELAVVGESDYVAMVGLWGRFDSFKFDNVDRRVRLRLRVNLKPFVNELLSSVAAFLHCFSLTNIL